MNEIITPALVIDLEALSVNIKKMADFGREYGVGIRPHFKSHKCVEIAKLQMAHGAVGITAQTIDEAEALISGGIKKILLANQLIEKEKIKRFVKLLRPGVEAILCVDDEANLRFLDRTAKDAGRKLPVLVEVDVGMNRAGRKPGIDTLAFTGKVKSCKNIVFMGLQGYEGHTVLLPERKEREEAAALATKQLVATKKLLFDKALECRIVSAGGTGTYDMTGKNPHITDIQPGSYVFMDAKYSGISPDFINALYVQSTVQSFRGNCQYTADAGHKALTSEFGMPVLLGRKGIIEKLNEEHTRLKLKKGKLSPGDKIRILPSHCCTTVNLYDNVYVVSRNKVIAVWKINRSRKS